MLQDGRRKPAGSGSEKEKRKNQSYGRELIKWDN
jgi:hypothetical protein